MGVQGMKMTGLSVFGIAKYFAKPESFAAYYDTAGRHRSTITADTVVWDGTQIDGGAVEALGISRELGITAGDLPNLFAGKHLQTGEQLSQRRGAPVCEIDPATGRVARDHDGAPVRKMAHPLDPITGEPDLSRAPEPVIDHSGGTDMAQIVVTMPKGYALTMLAAQKVNPSLFDEMMRDWHEVVADARTFLEDNARLGRRTIPRAETTAGDAAMAPTPAAAGGTAVAVAQAPPATRQQGSNTERVPVKLAMFTTFQWLARPTEETVADGRLPDFHPHAHVCIARTYLDPATGKTGTIDTYGLLEAIMATKLAAFVDGELHRRATERGLKTVCDDFDRDRNGRQVWTIEGIDLDAVRYMSTNHARRIALDAQWAAQHEGRVPSPATSKRLMAESKLPKDGDYKEQDSNPDFSRWHDEMAARGVLLATEDLVTQLRQPAREVQRAPLEEREIELWRRLEGPNGLHHKASSFTAYDASATLFRCAEGLDFTPDELADYETKVLDHTVVLATPINGGSAYVGADGKTYAPDTVPRATPEHLGREESTRWRLAAKAAAQFPAAPTAVVDAALAAQPRPLDDEQRKVVDAIASGSGLVILVGDAGSGKTTAMKPAVDALRTAGVIDQVVVVSTAALTGNHTGQKLDADESGSIKRIVTLAQGGHLRLDRRSLVVIDEVAMVSTPDIDALLEVIGEARLVGVGDPEQAQPIGAGGWFQDATEVDHPKAVFRLTEVHRQRDERDKAANLAIREGFGHAAIINLDKRGRVHVSATQQETWDRIAADNRAFRNRGYQAPDVVVIVPGGSNTTVDSLNRLIQHDRIRHGEIPREGFAYEATSSSGRAGSWSLHDGDPIIFLQNQVTSDGVQIKNGAVGTVDHVDLATGRASIKLDDGNTTAVTLERSAPTQPLMPRYAVHNLKYQGAENSIVQTVPPAHSENLKRDLYSANTRATDEAHVYLDHETHGEDPKTHLAELIESSPPIESARRVLDGAPQPEPTVLMKTSRRDLVPETKEHSRLYPLQRVAGETQVDRVKADPHLAELSKALDQLHKEGYDAGRTLANAARGIDLEDNDHPAQVLNEQLKTARKVTRDEIEHPEEGPRTPYLVGPADRGRPTPRPRMDPDLAYEIARMGKEWRQPTPTKGGPDGPGGPNSPGGPGSGGPGGDGPGTSEQVTPRSTKIEDRIARAQAARKERGQEAAREREGSDSAARRRALLSRKQQTGESSQEFYARRTQGQIEAAREARQRRLEQSRDINRDDGMGLGL
ncbi:ATP-dependent DNA helicase [Geodermatophilus sp. URMC 62]|uniref:ATP-dependent DNA helicase n=1 Tax=Geodermatophilus sp. URMC 62 TaxID=3423414 RepID=UPI00406C4DB4